MGVGSNYKSVDLCCEVIYSSFYKITYSLLLYHKLANSVLK